MDQETIKKDIQQIETLSTRAAAWVKAGHLRTVAYVIIAIILILGFNEIRDLRARDAMRAAELGTVKNEFQKLGDAFVGQGEVFKNKMAATDAAVLAQGRDLTNGMTQQGNQVRAMFQAQGEILAKILEGKTTGGVNPGTDGSFSNAKMIQNRDGAPPLTDITLRYNPSDPDPTHRLIGSWADYKEVFHPSVVEWQKKTDKSLSGTFRLTRDVYRPDGTLVGKEDIPLTGAIATFDPKAFDLEDAPRRWGLSLGPVWDYKDQKWYPGGGFDYRVSTNNLVQVGVTKNNAFVWWHYFIK